MNTSDPVSKGLAAAPGLVIRALRRSKALTLAQVSERTGLAISTLSKLEKGHISLSYDKLMLLSKGLDVELAVLLQPQIDAVRRPVQGNGRRVVQRAGEGQLVETSSYRQVYLATELLNKQFTPMVVEVRARSLDDFMLEFGALIHHAGEEFTLVLSGQLVFHSELYAPVVLTQGDSVYFDSEMGHAYISASDEPCVVMCACASNGDHHAMTEIFESASERLDSANRDHAREECEVPPRAVVKRRAR